MSEEKKENTPKKKEIWKKLRGFLVIVMVAVVSIAGTLAYLSRKTDRVTNTFTATDDIGIELTEPGFTPPPGGYQPGVGYTKDPQLANVTGKDDNSSEWVIMRVDYRTFVDDKDNNTRTYTPVDYATITGDTENGKGLINITQNLNDIPTDNNWIKVKEEWLDTGIKEKVFGGTVNAGEDDEATYEKQKCDYFIYKKTIGSSNTTTSAEITKYKNNLKTGTEAEKTAAKNFFDGTQNASITIPLFTEVTIKSQEQLVKNGYKKADGTLAQLPGFTIDAIGGAIKNQGDKTVEIDTGNLVVGDLGTAGKVSHTIVNELVKLLVDENFKSNTEPLS